MKKGWIDFIESHIWTFGRMDVISPLTICHASLFIWPFSKVVDHAKKEEVVGLSDRRHIRTEESIVLKKIKNKMLSKKTKKDFSFSEKKEEEVEFSPWMDTSLRSIFCHLQKPSWFINLFPSFPLHDLRPQLLSSYSLHQRHPFSPSTVHTNSRLVYLLQPPRLAYSTHLPLITSPSPNFQAKLIGLPLNRRNLLYQHR